ncbi:MAG: response regulator [Flavobacteriaceae bacterium]|nr:response regulator [Flavobacteriaceae bacterium]
MQIQDVAILIVDDVNAMRVQIQKLLETTGFKTFTLASNGAEAKEILENQNINFVIADWHMEPMNGLELLQFVRKHAKLGKLPFVMMTAESAKENVVTAIKAGVDQYLVKPLTKEQIQDKILQVLVKKKVLL